MPGLVDAPRLAAQHLLDGAAAGTVDAGETEDVHRQAVPFEQVEPAAFRLDAPPAAFGGGAKRRRLVDQRSAGIAVDAGRREIADPAQPRRRRDAAAVPVEHRIAHRSGGTELSTSVTPSSAAGASISGWSRSNR